MCSILVRMMSSNLQKTTKGSPARLKNKEFTLQKVVALIVAMSSFCVQLRGGDCYRCSKVTSSTVHFRLGCKVHRILSYLSLGTYVKIRIRMCRILASQVRKYVSRYMMKLFDLENPKETPV